MTDKARTAGAGRLVAVVVTHNRLDQLKRTLACLLETPDDQLAAVVVVDCASTDATPDWLAAQESGRLVVHRSEANIGGAGGFETGLRLAMERCAPDWVVVMDDDARPAGDAFATFHAIAGEAGGAAAALAAAVYFPDGRICEMNRPSVNPFWSLRVFLRTAMGRGRDGYHIPYGAYDGAAPRPIDLTSFVGLFLPAGMIRAAGYPDGRLFLYGDDVIYTLGLRKRGFSILFDPRIRFEHDCSTFQSDYRRAFRPLWKVYYTYRNGLLMYRRAAGPLFWPLLLVLWPKWRLAAARYGADRPVYLRLMRRAVRDAVTRRLDLSHDEVVALAEVRR
ncbi:Glycosyltransferase, GT2 family [Tranquillimonas rosea]|uniref:Glycosyltransferase, GT2 family n=1 Tax=Tranquillimonas rosea TaxID=641238 RepID=A0A1H9WZ17_9RHOB|nr:glycosyltransferase [Tranquillimonas rosea]SES39084.1 Glycosyltransferase, GT2 family [Tranquillimonas rosea]